MSFKQRLKNIAKNSVKDTKQKRQIKNPIWFHKLVKTENKEAKMLNWARCAKQRKKQTMLKGSCCIDGETAKQRLYSSILNPLY